ncbi:MAG: type II toxin-antitoxin system RelE/ParE family toxin [Thermodesulfovibrionales bacterium]
MWVVKYDERLQEWLETIPADIKAKVLGIVDMLVMFGPHNVREPYVKHVEGQKKLFEIRAKGKWNCKGILLHDCRAEDHIAPWIHKEDG